MTITVNQKPVTNQPVIPKPGNELALTPQRQLFIQLALALYSLKNSQVASVKDLPDSFKVLETYLGMGFDLKQSIQLMRQQDKQLVLQLTEDLGGADIFRGVSGLDLQSTRLDDALLQLASSWLDGGHEDAYLILQSMLSQKHWVAKGVTSVVVQERAVAKLQALKGESSFGEQLNYRLRVLPQHVFRAEGIIGMTAAFMTFRYVKGVTLELLASQAPKALVESTGLMLNRGPLAIAQANTAAFVGENITFSGVSAFSKYYADGKLTTEQLWQIIQTNLVVTGLIKAGIYGAKVAEGSIHGMNAQGLATQYLELQNITRGLTQNVAGISAMSLSAPIEYQMGLRQERPSFGLALGEGFSGHVSASLSNRLSGVAMQSHNSSMQRWDAATRFYSRAIGEFHNPWWEGMRQTINAWMERMPHLEELGIHPWTLAMVMEPGAAGGMVPTVGTRGNFPELHQPLKRDLVEDLRPARVDKSGKAIAPKKLSPDKIEESLSPDLKKAIYDLSGRMPRALVKTNVEEFSECLATLFLSSVAQLQTKFSDIKPEQYYEIRENAAFKLASEIARVMQYLHWSGQVNYFHPFMAVEGMETIYPEILDLIKKVHAISLDLPVETIGADQIVDIDRGVLSIGAGAMLGLLGVLRYKMRPGNNYLPFWYGLYVLSRDQNDVSGINGVVGASKYDPVNAKYEPGIIAVQGDNEHADFDSPQARVARRTFKYQYLNIPSSALASVVHENYIRELPQGASLVVPIKGIVGFTEDTEGRLQPLYEKDLDNPEVPIVDTDRPDHYIRKVIAKVNVEKARNELGPDGLAEQVLQEFFRSLDDPGYSRKLKGTREVAGTTAVELFYHLPRELRQYYIQHLNNFEGNELLVQKVSKYQSIDHITIIPIEGFYPQDRLYNGTGVELKIYGSKNSEPVKKLQELYDSDIVPTGISDRYDSGVWGGIFKNVITLDLGYEVAQLAVARYLAQHAEADNGLGAKLNVAAVVRGKPEDLAFYASQRLNELLADMVDMLVHNEGVHGARSGVPFDNEVMDDIRYCGTINVEVLRVLIQKAMDIPVDQLNEANIKLFLAEVMSSQVAATRNPKRGVVQALVALLNARIDQYNVNHTEQPLARIDHVRPLLPTKSRTLEGEISLPVLVARAHTKYNVQQRRLPDFIYRLLKIFMPKRFAAMVELPVEVNSHLRQALREPVQVNGHRIDPQQLQSAMNAASPSSINELNRLFDQLHVKLKELEIEFNETRRAAAIHWIDQINAMIYLIHNYEIPVISMAPQHLAELPFENSFSIGLATADGLYGGYTGIKVKADKVVQVLPMLGHLLRRYQIYEAGTFYVDLTLTGEEHEKVVEQYFKSIEAILRDFESVGYPSLKLRVIVPKMLRDNPRRDDHKYKPFERSIEITPTRSAKPTIGFRLVSSLSQKLRVTSTEITRQVSYLHDYLDNIYRSSNLDWTRIFLNYPEFKMANAVQAALSRPEATFFVAGTNPQGNIDIFSVHEHNANAFLSNPYAVQSKDIDNIGLNGYLRGIPLDELQERMGIDPDGLEFIKFQWDPLLEGLMNGLVAEGIQGTELIKALHQASSEDRSRLNQQLEPCYLKSKIESEESATKLLKAFIVQHAK